MKKLIIGLVAFVAVLSLTRTTEAKPATDTCKYIQDGVLQYAAGHYLGGTLLTTGYDVFGYNYQAHIFNGSYANAYLGRPGSGLPPYTGDDASYLLTNPSASSHWTWPFRNVDLQMKWNDAWLANKDCNSNGVLDRSSDAPVGTYKGSGAWLTNHAKGMYTSTAFTWDVSGSYVVDVEYLGVNYPEDLVLTQTGTGITGVSLALVGGGSPWTIDTGSVVGNAVDFEGYYNSNPAMRVHFTGTVALNGSMSGTWGDVAPGTRTGTWATTSGAAKEVHQACEVSDFVKIVAVPTDATTVVDSTKCPASLYDSSNKWLTAGGEEIGCSIWGEFAIIQEQGSDPCGEYGVIDYLSPLKKGLGNW